MLKKRNLFFLSLFILVVLLITSCLPKPLFLVTFDSQGGSAVDAQTVEEGELLTEPTAPTKTGYTFAGWYKEPECTNPWDFDSDTLTADVTLYAKWTTNSYTVTFKKNDASATGTMSAQTIDSGSSAKLKACAFSKTGWTFAGWATTPGGTVKYNDEANYTMGAADVTLYAKWTAKSYTVSISVDPEGSGTTTGSGTYHQGDLVTITAIAKSGYIFINWTDDDGLVVSMDNPYTFIMIARNINCTANFQKQNGEITIDGQIFYIAWVVDGDSEFIPFWYTDDIVGARLTSSRNLSHQSVLTTEVSIRILGERK